MRREDQSSTLFKWSTLGYLLRKIKSSHNKANKILVYLFRKIKSSSTLFKWSTLGYIQNTMKEREFLNHLEIYLAKRDGVDKLLKLSKYASKIIFPFSVIDETQLLSSRLQSFESSVCVSRRQAHALRSASFGEGLFFFVEQFIWLTKWGLIDTRLSSMLQKISAWAELVGYFGCIALNSRDLKGIIEAERRLKSSIEIATLKGNGCEKEMMMNKLREKKLMKKLSIVKDFVDGLITFSDIRDGKGGLMSNPLLLASAGLLSALLGTYKNWLSC